MLYVIKSDKNLSIIILYHNFLQMECALKIVDILLLTFHFSTFHLYHSHINNYFGNLEIIRFSFGAARA